VEQSATDVFDGQDYTHLAAMMAPRPMLLTYNAEDDCCFRAALVKPFVYDFLKPIYKLYGKDGSLLWHENSDPGNHNYQLDNRLQTYRFFSAQFKLPLVEKEIPSDAEIKSMRTSGGPPNSNLTTPGLARKPGEIRRQPIPADGAGLPLGPVQSAKAQSRCRYKPTDIRRPDCCQYESKGVETKRFCSFGKWAECERRLARSIGRLKTRP
jgi:hypothetical protein